MEQGGGARRADLDLKTHDPAAVRGAIEASGGRVTHELDIIGAVAAELTPAQLEQVRRATDAKAYASPAVKTSSNGVEDSGYPFVVGADALHGAGIDGAGVTVAVLDTGFWRNHEWLANDLNGADRVLAEYDAIPTKPARPWTRAVTVRMSRASSAPAGSPTAAIR